MRLVILFFRSVFFVWNEKIIFFCFGENSLDQPKRLVFEVFHKCRERAKENVWEFLLECVFAMTLFSRKLPLPKIRTLCTCDSHMKADKATIHPITHIGSSLLSKIMQNRTVLVEETFRVYTRMIAKLIWDHITIEINPERSQWIEQCLICGLDERVLTQKNIPAAGEQFRYSALHKWFSLFFSDFSRKNL